MVTILSTALVTAGALILGPTLIKLFVNNDSAKEMNIVKATLGRFMKKTKVKLNDLQKELILVERKQKILTYLNEVAENFRSWN